jgi:hypothetical protein
MQAQTFKIYILNLFIEIKTKFFTMVDSEFSYNSLFLTELYQILSRTLIKIENIYYKYYLYPKLQNIYQNDISNNLL